ncbi:MAG: hypothetical protein EU541_02345 [Promethearchaeota archaeon]|nr:MAG: hypothetical protein EU541_02345 [Candidatus Lokiarchaeota archaeon]
MGKKKSKLGIKTSKYFTKTCDNCGEEYPSFFTHCPHCGTAWDEKPQDAFKTKNIKIVAKITEDNFSEAIKRVSLIFSGDGGQKWYKVKMKDKSDFYEAEIKDVPEGATLIYLIEVYQVNGEIIRENNQGTYYKYNVAISEGEDEEEQSEVHDSDPLDVLKPSMPQKEDIIEKHQEEELNNNSENSPKDNLKECPNCHSKVKKHFIICPICGHNFQQNTP